MWTPPQWRIGFIIVFVVVVAMSSILVIARSRESLWGMAVAGGVIIGLFLSIAWTVRLQIGPLSYALLAAVIPLATAFWLIEHRVILPLLVVAAIVCFTWYLIYEVGVTRAANREVVSEVGPLGGDGRAGRALIVHHPGRSGFHTELQHAFAEGLQTQGWQVEITTASHATSTDLSSYQLLVLGAPTYNFRPARPALDYLRRLGNLSGKPVALVLSGGGMTDGAMRLFGSRTTGAGGRIVERIEVWVERPNEERHGIGDPREIMKRAGIRLRIGGRETVSASIRQEG